MTQEIDIDVQPIERGFFDIDINPDSGDFVLTKGWNTALKMSLWEERRADRTEMPLAEMRRGWWGNLLFDTAFEIGSKLWLLEQARLTQETLNTALDYCRTATAWLVEDGHADKVEVSGRLARETIIVNIKIFRDGSLVESRSFDIWENTVIEKDELN